MNSNVLLHLYNRVLEDATLINGISEKDMKHAIEDMHKIYQGSAGSLSKNYNCLADFNRIAYRCAYLFKYAPFHTALAYKAMSHALVENPYELKSVLDSLTGSLKICSLGGGPGTDVIGILAAMHQKFGFFHSSAKIVDIMSKWKLTFDSVLGQLRFGKKLYGPLSKSMSDKWFNWSFITADLQSEMKRELAEALEDADIVTMVKFVSASSNKETSSMIEQIFKMMKPGAFVLFIDNAAGGFKELITSAASKYKLNAVSTPLKHQLYRNETFNNIRYGYRSCFESKVAVQLLMKGDLTNHSNKGNVPPSSVPYWGGKHISQFQNFRIGPKPVDNFISGHEAFESVSPLNWQESNFSPSSEFSPNLHGPKAQIDSPASFYDSFESESFWSSSPLTSADRNWSIRGEYQNESFNYEPHHENFPSSPPSFWQQMPVPKYPRSVCISKLNTKAINDSGYAGDSFESELSFDSPISNNSPHSRAPHRVGRPKRKPYYSFYENESFSDTSVNSLPQYSVQIPDARNSLLPSPYRPNLQDLNQNTRICFTGIENSFPNQSPLIYESPLHQPWSNDHCPFETSQHFGKYKAPRTQGRVSMHRFKPYGLKRSQYKQSKNGSVSLQPSHQFPKRYKAPKMHSRVSGHRYKPYGLKRSQSKQSKKGSVSLQPSHQRA